MANLDRVLDATGGALLDYMNMSEAADVRAVCVAGRAAVAAHPWKAVRSPTLVLQAHLARWQASFPMARSLLLHGSGPCAPTEPLQRVTTLHLCVASVDGVLAAAIASMCDLTMFEAVGFSLPQEDQLRLVQALCAVPYLRWLHVNNGSLAPQCVLAIASASPHMHTLVLHGCAYEEDMLESTLQHVPKLEVLDLTLCRVNATYVGYVVARSLEHMPKLRELILATTNTGEVVFSAIADALVHTPRLTRLDVGNNSMYSMQDLGGALQHVPLLTHLQIWRNHPTSLFREDNDNGTSALAHGLLHTPNLTVLDIHDCGYRFVGEAGRMLAGALRYLPALQQLCVSDSPFKSATIELLRALQYLPRLRELDLCACCLDACQAAVLAQQLKYVPELTVLEVGMNGMEDDGIAHLAAELHHLPCLRELDVRDNDNTCLSVALIVQSVAKLPQFTTLSARCKFIRGGIDALNTALTALPRRVEVTF